MHFWSVGKHTKQQIVCTGYLHSLVVALSLHCAVPILVLHISAADPARPTCDPSHSSTERTPAGSPDLNCSIHQLDPITILASKPLCFLPLGIDLAYLVCKVAINKASSIPNYIVSHRRVVRYRLLFIVASKSLSIGIGLAFEAALFRLLIPYLARVVSSLFFHLKSIQGIRL